jgi:hypothetical protein
MSKTNTLTALAIINSAEIKASGTDLDLLKQSAIQQFMRLRCLRGEETLRGLLLGLTLHRIKASLPYGEFGTFIKASPTGFSDRWVNYLMRLALVFVDKSRATKPELLALPGDQAELALDGMAGAQRAFTEKAMKFVGDLSLAELLEKYGIKETKKLGGAREAGAKIPVEPITAEQLYLQSRDEIGGAIERAENLLLKENILQHLAGHPEEIRGVVDALHTLAQKVAKAAAPLLSGGKTKS